LQQNFSLNMCKNRWWALGFKWATVFFKLYNCGRLSHIR